MCDAFPIKALKHTRVIVLSGMTEPSLQLQSASLSKQIIVPCVCKLALTLNELVIDNRERLSSIPVLCNRRKYKEECNMNMQ